LQTLKENIVSLLTYYKECCKLTVFIAVSFHQWSELCCRYDVDWLKGR